MQLETYISDLLYRYECVTIPDFGSFLAQRVSATINYSTNTFYPPKKAVSFNEQIQKNDGLLAHYIADVEKIPFEVATKKITKRVKTLKAYLTQGETLTFNNIGEIVFNSEGKILFEPAYHLNYLTDSFGLSQFVSPSVTREVYKETVEAIEKVIPIAITPEKRKARPYLKYAAVALVALTLGGFGASNHYVNQIEAHNQIALEKANQQLETKIQEATFSLNTLPSITWNVTKQTGNYHIVAGAFRVEENSNKKVKQLNALGYNARTIGVNKSGLHEVVYGSYETGKEALKAIRDIRKNHNKDAWLKVESLTETNTVSNNAKTVITTKKESGVIEPLKEASLTKKQSEKDNILAENPNIIQIIKNVENLESGFYTVLGVYSDVEKKDSFLTNVSIEDRSNYGSFFDKKSQKYFVYNERFNDLETAKNALTAKRNSSFNGRIAIVKIVD